MDEPSTNLAQQEAPAVADAQAAAVEHAPLPPASQATAPVAAPAAPPITEGTELTASQVAEITGGVVASPVPAILPSADAQKAPKRIEAATSPTKNSPDKGGDSPDRIRFNPARCASLKGPGQPPCKPLRVHDVGKTAKGDASDRSGMKKKKAATQTSSAQSSARPFQPSTRRGAEYAMPATPELGSLLSPGSRGSSPGGSPPQVSMLEAREKIRSAAKERMDSENAEWKEKLEHMKPKIDDDVEDEEIGRERARLREEVEKKRVAEEKERKAQAAEFFSRVKAAKPLTDDKSTPPRDRTAAPYPHMCHC